MVKMCLCVSVTNAHGLTPFARSQMTFHSPLRARGHVFTFPTSLLSLEMMPLAEDFLSVTLVSYWLSVHSTAQPPPSHLWNVAALRCQTRLDVLRRVRSLTLYCDVLTVTAPNYDQVEVSPFVTLDQPRDPFVPFPATNNASAINELRPRSLVRPATTRRDVPDSSHASLPSHFPATHSILAALVDLFCLLNPFCM
jgi:hypothetical protein